MTIPYYVYRLQLVAHRDADDIRYWADLMKHGPDGRRKVGVLEGSVAADYSRKLYGAGVEVLESKDVAIMFEEVKRRGRLDATVQDNPASIYFTRTMPELKLVGEGRQPSFYVIYLRKTDEELAAATQRGDQGRAARRNAATDLHEVRALERRPGMALLLPTTASSRLLSMIFRSRTSRATSPTRGLASSANSSAPRA